MGFFFKFLSCLFLLLPSAIYGRNSCRPSACGKYTFSVRFPFRLQDDRQPINCGYPGFDLKCNEKGTLTLTLSHSEEFFVRSIDYIRQEIRLYDPSGCMAKRLPKFNLSGSPFAEATYRYFSFLSCPVSYRSLSSSFKVACLSNSTNKILAVPSGSADLYFEECRELYDGPIRLPQSFWSYYHFEDDVPLTWNVPDCRRCESGGGTCGFASSRRVKCRGIPATVAKGVRISLFVTIGGLSVSFLICFIKARRVRSHMNTITGAATQQPGNTVAGLDEATIQSYTKVVLGESCRLPGGTSGGGGTCSICLSEYTPKETVKCIPECTHCFHADCIDEWFRLTGTCPVCRIITRTPSPPTRARS